jgi:hypothetical protein
LAIVQISQITNRKGLAENLPQLAGAEFGWSTDTRQLYIGNGTLEDGAPVIGNTEILTEFSNILNLASTYTYQGAAAGYVVQTGVTTGSPVTQSLQSWLDQYASVKDFGATGDGSTDDTAAINRALYQLYCREVNPQIRRSLFFPAGVYRVTGSINIPPYATLFGEGSDNSVIALDSSATGYVAQTADALQNTGSNIGTGGVTPPQYITITNMGFTNLNPVGSVFLVQSASNLNFTNVGFRGAMTTAGLTSPVNATSSVTFGSTPSLICEQIVFNDCLFTGSVWGINTDQQIKSVTICNGKFDTLYQGILLGTGTTVNGGATGTRIVSNMFDNIYAEGIVFGSYLTPGINASGQNIFYDVGNHFSGVTGTPATSIIAMQSNNNVSISDLFARTASFSTTYPRISQNNKLSITTTNGESITAGTYTRNSGVQHTLSNNSNGTIFTISSDLLKTFMIDYSLTRETSLTETSYTTGTIYVASAGGTSSLAFTNNTYAHNSASGVTLNVAQTGTTISFDYFTTDTGYPGVISYSIRSLN